MKIRIRDRYVALSPGLRAHVAQRLDVALARFGHQIDHVTVRLSDGEHEDEDTAKRCRIDVALRPTNVRIEDTDADLFVAVSHAAHRVSRSVARAIERGHDRNGGHQRS